SAARCRTTSACCRRAWSDVRRPVPLALRRGPPALLGRPPVLALGAAHGRGGDDPGSQKGGAKGRVAPLYDGDVRAAQQAAEESEVVIGREAPAQGVLLLEQPVQGGGGVARADGTGAIGIRRALLGAEAGVAQVAPAVAREQAAGAGHAGRQGAVEQV